MPIIWPDSAIPSFYRNPVTVYPDEGKPFSPKLPKTTGYEAEIRYFLDMVEGRVKERILTAKDAREAIRLVCDERDSAKRVTAS